MGGEAEVRGEGGGGGGGVCVYGCDCACQSLQGHIISLQVKHRSVHPSYQVSALHALKWWYSIPCLPNEVACVRTAV